jgi:hypothetical protein
MPSELGRVPRAAQAAYALPGRKFRQLDQLSTYHVEPIAWLTIHCFLLRARTTRRLLRHDIGSASEPNPLARNQAVHPHGDDLITIAQGAAHEGAIRFTVQHL